jgi:hypothetical protein
MKKLKSGGGWPAVWYTWKKAREVGGFVKLWRAMRTKNACKTCALGMGGQRGGMVNELGHFPEVCKKSLQAMVADMQGAIRSDFWQRYSPRELAQLSPRELEACGRLVEPVRYVRETGRYEPICWDDALDRIAAKLRATPPDETFWYFSGRSSNEAFCCNCLRDFMAPTTSTIAATIAIRPAASVWPASRAAAPPRSCWKTWSTPTWCSSSAATRPAITRG